MESSDSRSQQLSREQILNALDALNRELELQSTVGEVCLFGGAVMVLAFNARLATKDVDALFQPSNLVREIAARVADEHSLPANWLNDGVKGFLSANQDVVEGSLPQFGNLRLTMPTPEYLLAMKCMSSRIGASAGDADDTADIAFLIRHLKLSTADAVLAIILEYYPPNRVPVKARFLVETLFEEGRV